MTAKTGPKTNLILETRPLWAYIYRKPMYRAAQPKLEVDSGEGTDAITSLVTSD